jgi:hypothetical protein
MINVTNLVSSVKFIVVVFFFKIPVVWHLVQYRRGGIKRSLGGICSFVYIFTCENLIPHPGWKIPLERYGFRSGGKATLLPKHGINLTTKNYGK